MTTAKRSMKEEIKQGIQQGKQEGIEEGIGEAKKEDAVKMLKKGYPVQEIIDITGLSEAIILKLKKDFN